MFLVQRPNEPCGPAADQKVGKNEIRGMLDRRISAGDSDSVVRHLRASTRSVLEALWILLLGSGLRRGEALGLQWKDIDLNERNAQLRPNDVVAEDEEF